MIPVALGILAISCLLQPVLLLVLARILVRRYVNRLVDQATGEIQKLTTGEPCQSATILNAIGRTIGESAGRSAKASLMADLSHVKRDANLDAADQATMAVGQASPGLGALLGSLGARSRKNLMQNPIAQLALRGLLGGPSGDHQGSGDGPGSAPAGPGRKHPHG